MTWRSDKQPLPRLGLAAAAILLLVLAVYWPALRGGVVLDDTLLIDRNPLVTGKLNLGSVWFRTDFPLSVIAFWLQWLVWGPTAAGYHIVNVLLHAASAVLVWRLLLRLGIPGAWLAAVIFAVHPVCAASAAWISELKNTLSLPFFLLSIECYLQGAEQCQASSDEEGTRPAAPGSSGGRRTEHGTRATRTPSGFTFHVSRFTFHPRYWLSLAAFLLALLSKTSTVMLPFVLLLCTWWQRTSPTHPLTHSPTRRSSCSLTWSDCSRLIPFFLLALAFGLRSIWFQSHGAMAGETVQAENFWARLGSAGWALWFYLGKALMPVHLNLIYPRWRINPLAPLSFLPLLLWCGALAVCWRFRRSWGRFAVFALGYFTVTLFPALGFFDMYFLAISRVSDHFQYLSLIGIIAFVAGALHLLLRAGISSRLPPCQASASPAKVLGSSIPHLTHLTSLTHLTCSTALVLTLSGVTWLRTHVLAHNETLWRDTLAKNPAAWPAHNNLGCILAAQNNYEEAIRHFEASLRLNPSNAQAHCNLARALSLQNRFPEAEAHFLTALTLKPKDAEIHRSFASALAERGRKEEALTHLRQALDSAPDLETRLQFAGLLHETGHDREAVAQYRQVLAIKPGLVKALNTLALLLATCADPAVRDGAEAVRAAEKACQLTQFQQIVPLGTLAAAYAEAGRFGDAVAATEKSLQLAAAAGDARSAALNRRFLQLYRAGKAWHQPPAKSDK